MHRIAFLVSPEFGPLDLTGPMSAFTMARNIYDAPYEIGVVSAVGGTVTGNSGLMVATGASSEVGHDDTVVVVGGPQEDPEASSSTEIEHRKNRLFKRSQQSEARSP